VRGYRQDALLTDNGAFASAELRVPVYRDESGVLQLTPFVDAGTVWNSGGKDSPNPNTLVGAGVGLRWQSGNRFSARLDYSIPLVNVESEKRTWQENGLYFSVEYNP
jgi:hemolysin activation/secretion protein